MTTRTSSVAAKLVEPRDVIFLDSITKIDPITLLEEKSAKSAGNGDLEDLAGKNTNCNYGTVVKGSKMPCTWTLQFHSISTS